MFDYNVDSLIKNIGNSYLKQILIKNVYLHFMSKITKFLIESPSLSPDLTQHYIQQTLKIILAGLLFSWSSIKISQINAKKKVRHLLLYKNLAMIIRNKSESKKCIRDSKHRRLNWKLSVQKKIVSQSTFNWSFDPINKVRFISSWQIIYTLLMVILPTIIKKYLFHS